MCALRVIHPELVAGTRSGHQDQLDVPLGSSTTTHLERTYTLRSRPIPIAPSPVLTACHPSLRDRKSIQGTEDEEAVELSLDDLSSAQNLAVIRDKSMEAVAHRAGHVHRAPRAALVGVLIAAPPPLDHSG
jgi:hypothetical protein